jgi:hypothetical protein
MSKLVYTDVASEFTYPDGRSIPVWYPVGPRENRVIEIPLALLEKTIKLSVALEQHMQRVDPSNKGVSVSELTKATGWSDDAIRTVLLRYPQVFRQSRLPEPTEYIRQGVVCVKNMYKFYRVAADAS